MRLSPLIAFLLLALLVACGSYARHADYTHPQMDARHPLVGVPCDSSYRPFMIGEHFVHISLRTSLLRSGDYGAPYALHIAVSSASTAARSFRIDSLALHSSRGHSYRTAYQDSLPLEISIDSVPPPKNPQASASERWGPTCLMGLVARYGETAAPHDLSLDFSHFDTLSVRASITVRSGGSSEGGVISLSFVPVSSRQFQPIV